MPIFSRSFWSVPLLCLVLLSLVVAGCGQDWGRSDPSSKAPNEYRDANAELGIDVEASQRERREQTAPVKETDDVPPLGFLSVELTPEAPKAGDTMTVVATLIDGASQYADVDLEWRANDRPVRGVSRSVLVLAEHRIRRGSQLKVVATATDEHGQEAAMSSQGLVVQNSPPQITSRISQFHGIHGLTLVAQDIDGDVVQWSVSEGPAGVSISKSGRIKVEPVALEEAYSGEVVFVAADPMGARAELHVPVEVSASTPTTQEVRTVQKLKTAAQMTDDEYARVNLKAGEALEEMTVEEVDDYAQKQEKASTEEQPK